MNGKSNSESCVIIGLAKTGTTGVYKLAKDVYRERFGDILSVFEPTRRPVMKNIMRAAQRGTPVVTKVMMAREHDVLVPYEAFDKRVLVVRDPRDMVISFLLFRPMLLKKDLPADVLQQRFDRFLDAIEKRIAGGEQSVFDIHELANKLQGGSVNFHRIAEFMERQIDLQSKQEFFVSKYEDFVAHDRDTLHRFLGADDALVAKLGDRYAGQEKNDWLAHITRSKSSGEWRQWFTQRDIDFFRPLFAPYMEHFGYLDDWDISNAAPIDRATSVEYMKKKFSQLVEQQQTINKTARGKAEITQDTEELVIRRAEDGDLRCIRNLVTHYDTMGDAGRERHDYWANKAALLGENL